MSEEIKLSTLKLREKGVIQAILGDSPVNTRLRELGLVTGTLVHIERIAPLGDPIELEVRGYRLSIRKEDAARVMVKVPGPQK